MNKSERSKPDDRLSELPESLIFYIFEFLPMHDVVRTTALSKRWKNLWRTVPTMNFDEGTIKSHRFCDFIYKTLILWRGFKLSKVKINFHYSNRCILVRDMDMRMSFVKEAEEIYLHLPLSIEDYTVPQSMYSSLSLKVLSIVGCRLQVDVSVQWNQLKFLNIHGRGFRADAIDKILRGSPNLEVLILTLVGSNENLCIRSSSLRMLAIRNTSMNDTELRISTPNPRTMELIGVPYIKCLFMNVSSLNNANFKFYDHETLLEGTLGQIIPAIQRVENLTLSVPSIKMLGAMREKYLLPPISSVKNLKLLGGRSYERRAYALTNIIVVKDKLNVVLMDVVWSCGRRAKLVGTPYV